MKKTASKIYTGIIFAFLFAPIIILLIFSFNAGNNTREISASISVFFSLYAGTRFSAIFVFTAK